ncbi:PREDICTED: protein NLRC3-like isoform X2 [Cyprinodon variegatus]|uniref:protein NLRC3-like isoform X2 n=1 Tax=Cyprinodon variegatus TaxID=28743 RepID=UPI0007428EDE|nr:PREDICTED: protein NLRC3-like isoform X2 [Cyprinodon variegatus]
MEKPCSALTNCTETKEGIDRYDEQNCFPEKDRSEERFSNSKQPCLEDIREGKVTLTNETISVTNEHIPTGDHNSSPSNPVSIEEKEATWVENNRAHLIQSVTLVMPIADQMLQSRIIHKEWYNQIKAATKSQDQMRELFTALNCTEAKSAFYRILRETQPETCETEDTIKDVIKKNKDYLKKKCKWEFEGTERSRKEMKSLDQIYTELYVVQGESEYVNTQHEIWEMEDKFRNQAKEGIKINCNDIFKSKTEDSILSESEEAEFNAVRTVMTKGIAGIGKTVSVKKFILDWADGKANQGLDFIFMFPFRELNLVKDDNFSLEALVKEFHPELNNLAVAKNIAKYKVLFIFDGLDESQLSLNFQKTKRLTDPTKESSVDTLVTNLIREHLLPSALVWITSRPGAVHRIPKEHVYQWTEVKGFKDPQKIMYFRNRIQNKVVAEKIIDHIKTSRSLFIMCHIPVFCWIASKVLESFFLGMGNGQYKNTKTPTTLIEMYTHFFCIQIKIAAEKYDKESLHCIGDILQTNKEFIFKLGKMAYEKLDRGEIIFSSDDLKKYGLDIDKAGVYCGLCTAIFKEESVFHSKKLYCFVHLTVQEYFAALFVYENFASKTIDSQRLKDFLILGSEEEVRTILDAKPVDLPLDELIEIAIANSTSRKTGELDIFLRFLIGMSLQSTQDLLQGLIQQTEDHSEVVQSIRTSLMEIDLLDCSPDRCLNLVHCLAELKDDSLYDSVKEFLNPNRYPENQLTPVQCSALADLMLMSNLPIEEFDLKRYTSREKGFFRLIPAIRNSKKARISGIHLDSWICETISSALSMSQSVLKELHLVNVVFYGTQILIDGLKNAQCKLDALSLSGRGFTGSDEEELALTLKSVIVNLKRLELSDNILKNSLPSVISDGLCSKKLEKLRLNRNYWITDICNEIAAAFKSNASNLRELELSYTNFRDSDMEILSVALMNTSCTLETLRLSHNKLTVKGCETLASAISSRPSSLKELDLSYNDLHDAGIEKLCNALTTSHCVLKALCVDNNEECWVDLKLLQKYACDVTLDENTAGNRLTLTRDHKHVTFDHEGIEYPPHPDRFRTLQVLCKEALTGRHYWEVECSYISDIGVGAAYKSITRAGDSSSEYSLGENEKSWCLTLDGTFLHNGSTESIIEAKMILWSNSFGTTSIGVYLDWPAGILSFFKVSPKKVTHLYTVRTTFTEPLYPAFTLFSGSIFIKHLQ